MQPNISATAQAMAPTSTVTVLGSTIMRTTYLTIHRNTKPTDGTAYAPTSASIRGSDLDVSSSRSSSMSIDTAPFPTTSDMNEDGLGTLPAIVTRGSINGFDSTSSMKTSTTSPTSAVATNQSSSASPEANEQPQKNAIIGGVSGAIAGLLLIGVLIAFCLRRRKPRNEDSASVSEKGNFRPALKRKWTELTGKGTPKPTPQMPQDTPVTVDEDHHIIRMNTTHWARPFVEGRGEGFRESVGPAQLRVVNPDPSRPTTPRISSETAGSFLKKQRTAFAAVLANAGRSRSNSRLSGQPPPNVPEIVVDPALSSECIAHSPHNSASRSNPSPSPSPENHRSSQGSSSMVLPSDPAHSSPSSQQQQQPQRPGLSPLQSAGSAAKRTLSHIGSILNPFRTPSNAGIEVIGGSRRHSLISTQSSSTLSSSRLSSRNTTTRTTYSDPFDLDRPSQQQQQQQQLQPAPPIYTTEMQRRRLEHTRSPPIWMVYEGT
ncbi:hypothetical protein KC332_g15625 [Hortaea werneckii]|uniref:Uncharacterized protein n=1 Tax=Hortaea werneckii EXF-2000 TaxID=1157616 RepID=A0A1Z5SL61_HORWE|nr:hypothetical protein KC350_g16818 [Hortaea werneckii]OTA16955.1 hypothetical protein BTJ68_15392 [Hortaea werneckii EXF-2000]KAI6801509.1 hypothetical protein KC358_g15461 [Hortaea werneckii]KAI6900404.1 hypothetical protein KC348_g16856 [Hortaea werneckii]KAI6927316.1 hypothetical protein KC341_g12193 [Hortaea werneckii]